MPCLTNLRITFTFKPCLSNFQQKGFLRTSLHQLFPDRPPPRDRATRNAGYVLSPEKALDIPWFCARWSESGIGENFPAKARLPLVKFIKGIGFDEDLDVRDVLATEYRISIHEGGLTCMRRTKTGVPLPVVPVRALDTDRRDLLK